MPTQPDALLLMRRDTSEPTVAWAAEVPEEHIIAFAALLPIHGARTWVVSTGLSKFLDVVEANEAIRAWAVHSIENMQYVDTLPPNRQWTSLRIPRALYVRFNDVLPMKGATTWFIRRMMKNTIQEFNRANLNLEEMVEHTVSAFLRDEVETEQM